MVLMLEAQNNKQCFVSVIPILNRLQTPSVFNLHCNVCRGGYASDESQYEFNKTSKGCRPCSPLTANDEKVRKRS